MSVFVYERVDGGWKGNVFGQKEKMVDSARECDEEKECWEESGWRLLMVEKNGLGRILTDVIYPVCQQVQLPFPYLTYLEQKTYTLPLRSLRITHTASRRLPRS